MPRASMVAYAPATDLGALVLHLSRLAGHTGNLLANPAAALAVSEPDGGRGDPQILRRVSLEGYARPVQGDHVEHAALREIYLGRLPRARPRFEFPDFVLFRFVPVRGHYVGGFGRAREFEAEALWARARRDAGG